MAEEISIGVVRWFSNQRGFGFITPNDGGEDLFVHHSSILTDGFRTLTVGHEVEFQLLQDHSGRFKAVHVRSLHHSPPPPFSDRFNTTTNRPARAPGFGTRSGRSFNGCGGGYSYSGGGGGYSYSGGGGGGGVNGGGVCYNCRRPGHFARDCPVGSGGGGGGGGGGGCYQCGEVGHLARECPNDGRGGVGGGGGTGACFNCGELGHMARDCRGSSGGGGGGRGFSTRMSSGGGCFNCGKPGHFARECTEGQEE